MQIMINTRQCPCRTLNDECSLSNDDCYEDDVCSFCPLIGNGGVKLPKGHGRLIYADDVKENLRKWIGYLDSDMIERLNIAIDKHIPTIIEGEEE